MIQSLKKVMGFSVSKSSLSWIAASTLIVVAHGAPSRAEDLKIGVVDMQKALVSVDAGKKAKASLEKEVNTKTKELQTEEQSLQKAVEEFRKQSLVMNEEARNKKQAELQDRVMKHQEKKMKTQGELQQKEQELTAPIIVKMRGIIADMAKKKNYSVVLEKNENTVLFSQDKDDMTQEVISAFNSQAKS